MNEAKEMIKLKWHLQTWGYPISHSHWLTFILALPLFLRKFFMYIRVCVCVCVCVCLFCVQLLSHVPIFETPWTVARQTPLSVGFSRQQEWSGCHLLLQGLFPTRGSNPYLLHLLLLASGFFTTAPPGKPIPFPSSTEMTEFHHQFLERNSELLPQVFAGLRMSAYYLDNRKIA